MSPTGSSIAGMRVAPEPAYAGVTTRLLMPRCLLTSARQR